MSALFAVLTLPLAANQVATGLALTVFGTGLSALLGQHFTGRTVPPLPPLDIPFLSDTPVIGPLLFHQVNLESMLPPSSALADYLPERRALEGGREPGAAAPTTWPVARAAVASTLLVGLELAKQKVVNVEQEHLLAAISVYLRESSGGGGIFVLGS